MLLWCVSRMLWWPSLRSMQSKTTIMIAEWLILYGEEIPKFPLLPNWIAYGLARLLGRLAIHGV